MSDSLEDTKTVLADATLQEHPLPDAPTCITTDALDFGVGAVFHPLVCGALVPLAFFSQKLYLPECKYSAFDHELLALYLGIHHFRHFLEGQRFIAFTDHKALTFYMSKASELWSALKQQHLLYI